MKSKKTLLKDMTEIVELQLEHDHILRELVEVLGRTTKMSEVIVVQQQFQRLMSTKKRLKKVSDHVTKELLK